MTVILRDLTLDEGDDPFDEATGKANPGLGICKRWDDMRRLAKRQKSRSRRVWIFTKHLNIWVQGEKAWMDMARWEKCRDAWTVNFGQLVNVARRGPFQQN
jgi:phage terminase large subunit-like protein